MWKQLLAFAARRVDCQKEQRRRSTLAAVRRAAAVWDGSPQTILEYQAVEMPATPTCLIVLAAYNTDSRANDGEIAISSGGSKPTFLELPALTNQPVLVADDYQGNNLKITNTATAPVCLEIFAPGFGKPEPLPDGTVLLLPSRMSRATTAQARYQQLVMKNSSGQTSFLFYEGTTAALYTVNASAPPNVPNLECHSVPGNTAKVMDNWGAQTLYVANVSRSSDTANVTLLTLSTVEGAIRDDRLS